MSMPDRSGRIGAGQTGDLGHVRESAAGGTMMGGGSLDLRSRALPSAIDATNRALHRTAQLGSDDMFNFLPHFALDPDEWEPRLHRRAEALAQENGITKEAAERFIATKAAVFEELTSGYFPITESMPLSDLANGLAVFMTVSGTFITLTEADYLNTLSNGGRKMVTMTYIEGRKTGPKIDDVPEELHAANPGTNASVKVWTFANGQWDYDLTQQIPVQGKRLHVSFDTPGTGVRDRFDSGNIIAAMYLPVVDDAQSRIGAFEQADEFIQARTIRTRQQPDDGTRRASGTSSY